MGLHHLMNEVQCTISRSFRTQNTSAPFQTLTGERSTVELAGQFLIHAKQIANLATAHTDVAGRHIHIRTDYLIQLAHESLAEAHDFGIALAAWREVTAALATAHRQCGECILESLLESQELQNAQIDRRMEAQTALIRTDSTVELHTVTDVHLHLALVVHPRYTEGDDTLRFHDALHNFCLFKFRMLVVHVLNRFQHFAYSLQVLHFAWMLLCQVLHNFLNVHSFKVLFVKLTLCYIGTAKIGNFLVTAKKIPYYFSYNVYNLLKYV